MKSVSRLVMDNIEKLAGERDAIRADLERQQPVVEAAKLYTKEYDTACAVTSGRQWGKAMDAVIDLRQKVKDLAALDAVPEGEG